MGRIANFFKKAWNGVKKGVKWIVNKGVDVGKKIIDNPIVKAAATAGGTALGIDPLTTMKTMDVASRGLGVVQGIRDNIKQFASPQPNG